MKTTGEVAKKEGGAAEQVASDGPAQPFSGHSPFGGQWLRDPSSTVMARAAELYR